MCGRMGNTFRFLTVTKKGFGQNWVTYLLALCKALLTKCDFLTHTVSLIKKVCNQF